MSFSSMLPETVTVEMPAAPTRDASGGVIQTWVARQTAVPAQVNSPSASQRLQYAVLQMAVPYTIFTEYAGVENGDRILLDDDTYVRVTGVARVRAQGSLGEHYEITGEEVRP